MEVRSGEVFGLLGPNGAGKTTLIRSLLGYLNYDSGTATIAGHDCASDSVSVRRSVAYLPGDARVPRHMNGRGVLKFFAGIHPHGDLARSRSIAERLELDLSRRVGMMSTGMRQKVALAVVLGMRTPVMILDEPTANLDPSVRGEVLELVLSARDEGRTVMLSSHVMSEIEDTCGRVAFLKSGQLVKRLVMKDLSMRHRVWLIPGLRTDDATAMPPVPPGLIDRVSCVRGAALPTTYRCAHPDDVVRVEFTGEVSELFAWFGDIGAENIRIEPVGLRTIYDEVHRGGRVRSRDGMRDGSRDGMREGLVAS